VVNHPKDIANKTFDLIEYEKTGEEIIQAFTEVNGSPPEIHEISEAEWEAQMAQSGLPSLAAGISRKWGTPDFNWTGERVKVEGWKGKTLAETVKEILNK